MEPARRADVREADPVDADALIEAYEWLFEPPGARPPGWDRRGARERLLATIADRSSTALLALEGPAIVGFCTAYLTLRSVRYGQRAWVEDLAVAPAHRSRGIGTLLLDRAHEWARERGAATLELETAEPRVDAQRFYEAREAGWRSVAYGWRLARR